MIKHLALDLDVVRWYARLGRRDLAILFAERLYRQLDESDRNAGNGAFFELLVVLSGLYEDQPQRALRLVDEGLALLPMDTDLLFLKAFFSRLAGKHEDALIAIIACLTYYDRAENRVASEGRLSHYHNDDALAMLYTELLPSCLRAMTQKAAIVDHLAVLCRKTGNAYLERAFRIAQEVVRCA